METESTGKDRDEVAAKNRERMEEKSLLSSLMDFGRRGGRKNEIAVGDRECEIAVKSRERMKEKVAFHPFYHGFGGGEGRKK